MRIADAQFEVDEGRALRADLAADRRASRHPAAALLAAHGLSAPVRRAILARLRTPRRDTLARVLLTPAVVRAWERHAHDALAAMPSLTPEQVAALPDEQAQADGSLLIWVDTPHGAVSMRVEVGQWAWASSP